MPTDCRAEQLEFEGVGGRRVIADCESGAVTSDAGALLLRHADRTIGLIKRAAAFCVDHRLPQLMVHDLPSLIGQRIVGIALGYEDVSDHDDLCHDPVLSLLAGRLEPKRRDCAGIAGKSTLNCLEHAPAGSPGRCHKISHGPAKLETLFVDLFLEAHAKPPKRIILDLDATDDPLHGHQEGRLSIPPRALRFMATMACYCYLPLYVFCGQHLLTAKLRTSNIDASAGAGEEIERIVMQIRARCPRVRIWLRAAAGFARDELMTWCETNRVDYVFGLARNDRLIKRIGHDFGRPRRPFAPVAAPNAGSRTSPIAP